jgi:hypothetical protein
MLLRRRAKGWAGFFLAGRANLAEGGYAAGIKGDKRHLPRGSMEKTSNVAFGAAAIHSAHFARRSFVDRYCRLGKGCAIFWQ